MHLLVYTSLSTSSDDCLMTDVDSIVASSRRNNPESNITGAFFRCGRRFLQFLEGEQINVYLLFARISEDTRHSNIELLVDATVSERAFGDWSMDYFPVDHDVRIEASTLKKIVDVYQRNFSLDGRALSGIVRGLVEHQDEVQLKTTPC